MEQQEQHELIRRLEDLAARCERSCAVTSSHFLTPAEQFLAERSFKTGAARLLLHGGHPDCERRAAFFLPDWLEPEYFDPSEYLRAIRLTAHFGAPGHRDYLGALLGMGIGREWLGDIWVEGESATVFCLPSSTRRSNISKAAPRDSCFTAAMRTASAARLSFCRTGSSPNISTLPTISAPSA